MIDREALLGHLHEHEQCIGAQVADRAEAALQEGRVQATDFLEPPQREVAAAVCAGIPEMKCFAAGGYRGAVRRRLIIHPAYLLDELVEIPVAALALEGTFPDGGPRREDVREALLGTGMRPGKVGDVIASPQACQAVVASESVDDLLAGVQRVGEVAVEPRLIELEQLAVPPERVREIRATVASLRLDAVASSGFGTSRNRMARDIRAQRVLLNWRPALDPAAAVREGDVIAIRGRGQVVVERVAGPTRKGRTGLTLKRMT